MRFLLVGNYGVGNLGDEMLREYFLKAFPEVEWIVISANAGCPFDQLRAGRLQVAEVPRLPFGLRSFLTTPWWRTLFTLWNSDGMVFGGGTLLTDIESIKAPMLWWWHAFWARLFRKKIILAFQGIGPFRTRAGEWCSRWVVEHAECVIVRDDKSLKRISHWKNKKCVQSFDPAISLFDKENSISQNERTKKVFIIIPRANATGMFLESSREVYEKRKAEWSAVRIISLEPEDAAEQQICRRLSREFHALVTTPRTWKELQDALQDASFLITQRYHGAIAALAMCIPFVTVPQMKGDKLASIAHIHRDDAMRKMKEGEAALRCVLSPSVYPL
ncbi:MAG: hypothetical protein Greene101449_1068 [Candidatus Peregrinibacteria bacterium Greene1014_49]|nr:MAG: hypothetical protein Greene101449_1068 [Candidatus Peregrinibacteria bacterium Greene1014_49]